MLAISFALPLLSIAFGVSETRAGSSVVQCSRGQTWLNNDDGQDPCDVWAMMQSVCDPTAVVKAPISTRYLPPGASSPTVNCDCNKDAYNLMASCTYCQGKNVWPSLSEWSSGCSAFSSSWLETNAYRNDAIEGQQVQNAFTFATERYRPSLSWDAMSACTAGGSRTSATCSALLSTNSTTKGSNSGGSGRSSDPIGEALVVVNGPLIAVLIIFLVLPSLGSIIALIVCCVRQGRRRRFYRPLAEYYQSGGTPPITASNQVSVAPYGGFQQV